MLLSFIINRFIHYICKVIKLNFKIFHSNQTLLYCKSLASLTLFRLGFFGQSVTGGGSSDPPPPLYLWNQ